MKKKTFPKINNYNFEKPKKREKKKINIKNPEKNKLKLYMNLLKQKKSKKIESYFFNSSLQKKKMDPIFQKNILKEFFNWSKDIDFALENNIEIIVGDKFVKNENILKFEKNTKTNNCSEMQVLNDDFIKNENGGKMNNFTISENIKNLKNSVSFKDFIKNSYLAYKKNFEETENFTEEKNSINKDYEKNENNEEINNNEKNSNKELNEKNENFNFNFELREKIENSKKEDLDIIEVALDFKERDDFSHFSGFCEISIFKRKEDVKKTCSTNFSNNDVRARDDIISEEEEDFE